MAEPRKVQFVTLSAFAAGAAAESRKRRLEDEADFNFGRAGEVEAATGAGGAASSERLDETGDREKAGAEKRATVRLNLSLSEPDDRSSVEFNYGELVQNLQVGPPVKLTQPGRVRLELEFILLLLEVFVRTCLCWVNRGGGVSAPCPSVD